jgi:surface-anchored protein
MNDTLNTLLLNSILCSTIFAQVGESTDLILGHYEVHIDYNLVSNGGNPDDGWLLSVSYDEDNDFNDGVGITRLDTSKLRLVATPGTEISVTSAIDHLGQVGDPFWLLPQSNNLGQLFLGFRTVISPGIFQSSVNGFYAPNSLGNIVFEMISVSGTGVDIGGNFAMWESKSLGNLEFHFDSSDGFTGDDRLEPVPIGAHTHYNWGMSKPGSYEVTFRASGRLNPWQPNGNSNTSKETTFTFVVPFSGYRAGTVECRLNDSVTLPAALYHSDENCEYAPDRIALITDSQMHQNSSVSYGYTMNFTGNTAAPSSRVGVLGSSGLTLPTDYTIAATPVRVISVEGPGTLTTTTLSSTSLGFAFSEAGIYRVTLLGQFDDSSSGGQQDGEAFELVFLAGMAADYSYTAWADSFERTHATTPGTLSDAYADSDLDGLPNGVEFQLFWNGFDTLQADAALMPMPEPRDGYAIIEYLRDTYKDDFDGPELSLMASYSQDLTTWAGWHRTSESATKGLFETGADPDQDLGRIMKRQLRIPENSDSAFFRFDIH